MIAQFSDWQGTLDELVEVAAKLIDERQSPAAAPSVRVARDYARRGILSPPRRRGRKSATYALRQLLELVAARVLVSDGWPLGKIAEHLPRMKDSALIRLIEGDSTRQPRRPESSDDDSWAFTMTARLDGPVVASAASPSSDADFAKRALRLSRLQAKRRAAQKKLGLDLDAGSRQRFATFRLAPWCLLVIERERLSRLSIDDAELIGAAIAAMLVTATAQRGGNKSMD